MKDILTILGIDTIVGIIVHVTEPSFLKWVFLGGIVSLIGLYLWTKHSRISAYGTQLVMAFILAIKFA